MNKQFVIAPLVSAWDQAHKDGRKVFFEAATMTIRQCPENYCLAMWRDITPHKWVAAVDKAAPVEAWDMQRVLDKWQTGSQARELARAVELELYSVPANEPTGSTP